VQVGVGSLAIAMKSGVLLLLLLIGSNAKPNPPGLIETSSSSHTTEQTDLKLRELQSIQDLSNLVESGRQKLAEASKILRADPPAGGAAGGATGTSGVALDIAPPQLEPLALPSYGQPPVLDDLTDIQREQAALKQKRLLVAQQKHIIAESEENAAKLAQLIAVNKQIAQKNEDALAISSQHLVARFKAYTDRLAAQEAAAGASGGTSGGASGAAAPAKPAALFEEQQQQRPATQQPTTATTSELNLMRTQADELRHALELQGHSIDDLKAIIQRRGRHRRHGDWGEEEDSNS